MKISQTVEYKPVQDSLRDLARNQVPFAMARTATALGQDVQAHLRRQLPIAFDRPTPFAARGLFVKSANKATLVAEVGFAGSEEAGGRGAREYLRPGTEGKGARNQKKTEYLLTRAGFLPAGWVTVPGRYIMQNRLDGYGNMPGSYYRQIVRNLQIKYNGIKPVYAASQRRAARMGVENEFFAVAPGANRLAAGGGWLPPGVYRRVGRSGGTLQQYLKFVRRAGYRKRLDVPAEALVAVRANVAKRWGESIDLIATKFRGR